MNQLSKYVNYLNWIVFTFILLYGYTYIFIGVYYCHPNAEDFSLTALPYRKGVFQSIQSLLINYDGRYFTNFLHAINPMAYGWLEGYKWTIAFCTVFPIATLFYFLSSLFYRVSKVKLLGYSAFFMLINYSITPSLPHLLYWMVSSFVYLFSWCFLLLWLGSYIRFYRLKPSFHKDVFFLITCAFLICAMGINEMFLIINLVVLFCIALYLFIYNRLEFKLFIPIMLVGIVAVAFFVSNPGIIKRFLYYQADYVDPEYWKVFILSLQHFSSELITWNVRGASLFLFFLFTISFSLRNKFFEQVADLKIWQIFILFFVGISVFYISTFTYYVPMGHDDIVPYRIYTSVFLCFQVLAIFALVVLTKIVANKLKFFHSDLFVLGVLILSAYSLMSSRNNVNQLRDEFKKGILALYDAEMKERYRLINVESGKAFCWDVVEIPLLKIYPESIYFDPEITPHRETFYWNNAYEAYFGVDEVRLVNDTVYKIHKYANE